MELRYVIYVNNVNAMISKHDVEILVGVMETQKLHCTN